MPPSGPANRSLLCRVARCSNSRWFYAVNMDRTPEWLNAVYTFGRPPQRYNRLSLLPSRIRGIHAVLFCALTIHGGEPLQRRGTCSAHGRENNYSAIENGRYHTGVLYVAAATVYTYSRAKRRRLPPDR